MASNETQWINTNDKPYYLSYQMPLSINNRSWFFWANTVEGWRKVLNRANALAVRNKVSFVFLHGEITATVSNYIKKLNNPQMVVLCADYVSAEYMKAIGEADKWLKGLQPSGGRAKDENKQWTWDVSPMFIDLAKSFDKVRIEYERFLLAKSYADEVHAAVERDGYRVFGDFRQKTVSGGQEGIAADLLAIIKELFPCGIEADTDSEFAYKRIAVPKMIKLGLAGETDDSLVKNCGIRLRKEIGNIQFSLFDDYSNSAMQIVAVIREAYRRDIKRLGYCEPGALCEALTYRPYGFYECNYYYYIVAFALSAFKKGYYTIMSHCWCMVEDIEFTKHTIFLPVLFVQTDKQRSLTEKLRRLFEIEEPTENLSDAIRLAIVWIEKHIHYDSVDRVSDDLFALLRGDGIKLYSLQTERYDDWLDEETLADLHDKLQTVDDDFFRMLAEKYGEERARLFKRKGYVKGTACGWLWRSEMVDESVENYMSKILCRECGRVLNPFGDENCYEISRYDGSYTETHDFSLKQIQGLNKKFFGRYQTDYFCIPCMAQILETTEWELWEKMHFFKEQGCTLF